MKLILLWTFFSLPVAFAYNPDTRGDIQPPYLVYLKSDYLPCTGVLIHPLWVITAAHCNLPGLLVVLGITDPSNTSEADVQVVIYEKIINHPQYLVSSIEYDLTLIKLINEAELGSYVNVVKLPRQPVDAETMCDVTTWAYNFCDTLKDPDMVQKVEVSVITENECRNGYPGYNIKNNMICVGIVPGMRKPCKEVSAAPAVCNGTLYGILAYADGCILRADVGIYTSIFHHLPWIKDTIQNN
ncbi:PREDICTED: serine protease 58 [Chinchilla lanigera]|uniref:Serine protease 58 n=1 Tax=Chinchilla lanigera TaxID=34839 RepID=A0A8C2UQ36_CHILA|nr:PREDICTED: serine protease 58 [Chinchilla lanigera]